MKFERNEIYTGLLVLVTVAVLIGAILLLAVPGIFKPLRSYQIFFDNAAGLQPGAPVSLAGRKIGQVSQIDSPVPMASRPARYPEYEVVITVNIDSRTSVYRNSTPRMQQNGLLGEQIVDFVGGTEDSGVAEAGYKFVGQRVPDLNSALPKVLAVIEPVASTATLALSDLRKTIDNLNAVFSEQSELNGALAKLHVTADNLATLTAPGGGISASFTNLQAFTDKLRDDHGPLMTTLNKPGKDHGPDQQGWASPETFEQLAERQPAGGHCCQAGQRLDCQCDTLSPAVRDQLSADDGHAQTPALALDFTHDQEIRRADDDHDESPPGARRPGNFRDPAATRGRHHAHQHRHQGPSAREP